MATLWAFESQASGPGDQFEIVVLGNVDGRRVAVGWQLMCADSNGRDKRDGGSLYTMIHENRAKTTRWRLVLPEAPQPRPKPGPRPKHDLQLKMFPRFCMAVDGNRDGRTTGVGQWLAVHGSNAKDKRDG